MLSTVGITDELLRVTHQLVSNTTQHVLRDVGG